VREVNMRLSTFRRARMKRRWCWAYDF